MKVKKEIPIVFSVDDNYVPFLAVAANSILKNSSKEYFYRFCVLNTGITKANEERLRVFNTSSSSIEFINVQERLDKIGEKLPLRDYYTNTIYYRFFIPALFPEYDKIIYFDSDIVVLGDVAEFYNTDLKDNIVGAIHEEVMSNVEIFGRYSEEFLDVPRMKYFNSGILLINTVAFKKERVEEKFLQMLKNHKFKVAPDQDYLNVICNKKVHYFDIGWNKTPLKNVPFERENLKLIHYKINFKPWHYDDVLYGEYFWKYAKGTLYEQILLDMKNNYSQEEAERDELAYVNLKLLAKHDIESDYNYKKSKNKRLVV